MWPPQILEILIFIFFSLSSFLSSFLFSRLEEYYPV